MSQGFVNPIPSPLPVNKGGTGVLTSTGTVAVVLSTSPTLVTPTIGAATATSIKISNTGIIDTNGKVALALSATTSAVNGFTLTNSIATASPSLSATGTDTNIIMTLNGKGTGGVATKGTSTNDNAAAGYVGEFVDSGISTVTATTSGVVKNLTSISLTAGDWDVFGQTTFNSQVNSTTSTVGISITSAVLPATGSNAYSVFSCATQATLSQSVYTRISIASTTTVYLVGSSAYSGTAPSWSIELVARRIR